MLVDQQLLRIPGPTPIPPSVERAMIQPMIGHRGQECKDLIQKLQPGLQAVFGTKQDVFIIAGSGTAGLETAVVNATQPGDEVLVIVTGAFGDRFAKICDAFERKTHRLEVTYGEAVDVKEVKNYLEQHPSIKAVFATYCETSTAVLNPVKEIAEVVHQSSNALFIVDGVSCVAGVETKMDEWGIDVLVTGSQKAFMLPAGLTFVSASKRAWDVIDSNSQPRFYLDLKAYKKNLDNSSTPYTPAVSLLYGLEQVLELFNEEGLEQVYERHQLMMEMTRAACKALDLPLLTSDQAASPTVTAVQPTDFDPEQFRKVVKKKFGLTLAGGQQHLKGKIFRIGHMGYCSPADVFQYISLIELGLILVGKKIDLGKGVAAAQAVYLDREVETNDL
ncbi:aspartate aminotransferase-like enzyme [Salirhabdus euzebyi]|uniref:Aspartate aminotransferase-like enzyme n=1 Tax=Salirhabdus euzebyi TaxID=394506 RepID=A0A841PVI9_9BACI|nr:alanine--glyoxylate aminotransferase family protein [Salirhabdus euzebyi]MBB6451744.1 aspartate aminotransferase-like enzyme [Salirhabdus euzebyi]